MKYLTITLTFIAAIFAGCATTSSSKDDPRTASVVSFLSEYQSLTNAYDPAVLNLYSDNAVLRGVQVLESGAEQPIQISIAQYAAVFESAIEVERALGVQIKFSNLKVSFDNEHAVVTADRYTSSRCFNDTDYRVILTPDGDTWQIIDEYQVIPVQSRCDEGVSPEALTAFLNTVAEQTNVYLPAQIDEDTVLQQLIVNGNTLTYDYMIITFNSHELSGAYLRDLMLPMLIEQGCTVPSARSLLDKGATLHYQYAANDDVILTDLYVDERDC